LELFAIEGEAILPRLRGMFAFVIWDRVTKRAFAARDPYGIKPLYYSETPDATLLASQVKALLATGEVSRAPSPCGQAGFWLLGSVPEPDTWYRDIHALPAGHCMWIVDGRVEAPRRWWDIGAAWREARPCQASPTVVHAHVATALRRAVAAHLVSDVPVGVFLSGGIDSGALAGLTIEAGGNDVQAVTLAFDEFLGGADDEAPVARQIAAHYGVRHHVRIVTRAEFLADLPRIFRAMDQPSIDGVNTWYVSKAAAELGLKVVISGVGGDELFQGYSSFSELPRLVKTWGPLSRVPGVKPFVRFVSDLQARRTGNGRWRYTPDWARSMAGAWWLRRSLFSPSDLPTLMGHELAVEALKDFDPTAWIGRMSGPLPPDLRLSLAQIESTTYLRNQLLRDADWASMDHSVELRTPLVDAWLLRELAPMLLAFERFPSKILLARAPEKALPKGVVQRRKTGFGIPMGRWLTADNAPLSGVHSRVWARRVAGAIDDAGAT
jgi:asparagine synthase (glutamine-hydrolysing)